ncbi:MAG: hypothetical protein FWG70_08410 [Oscillospiraceae bacterium]|nr:hypothetical protein [Oscillospiraceae bacterium]
MKAFDIFIIYISWGSGGKKRPVLVYALNNEIVRAYPITTQYESKSDEIKAKFFKINNWEQAGLDKQSYVDTGTRFTRPLSFFENIEPIGNLTDADIDRFIEFTS